MTGNAGLLTRILTIMLKVLMTATASDTITLNGSTTGGLAGTIITCKAIGANRWMAYNCFNTGGTGDAATPFSAVIS